MPIMIPITRLSRRERDREDPRVRFAKLEPETAPSRLEFRIPEEHELIANRVSRDSSANRQT